MTRSLRNKRIWIAGHDGLVGGALLRHAGFRENHIITASRAELDLREQAEVRRFIKFYQPDMVLLAAGKVGGIEHNRTHPAGYLYDNMMIAANVIHGAAETGVEKLLYLGSSCIYPRMAPQPVVESALMTGALEPSNEFYALAKIAGIRLCQAYRRERGLDFISAMPCNLYGKGDRFDALRSHVIPALILKMDQARLDKQDSVSLWGTGTALREFLYVDDLAEALFSLMSSYSGEEPVNIGSGTEMSIAALAAMIADRTGYGGEIMFDPSKPDGMPRKIVDSTRMRAMGWAPRTGLAEGLDKTIADYRSRQDPDRHGGCHE